MWALLVSLVAGSSWAGSDREAAIVARALAYDYNLKARVGDSLVVAVLYKEGEASSVAMAEAWMKGFESLGGVKVAGLPLTATKLAFSGLPPLKATIASKGVDVLLVCEGLDAELGGLKEISHAQKLLTIAGKEAYVTQGLTLGVFPDGDHSTIEVNLGAAAQENVSFSSDLLRLAKVTR